MALRVKIIGPECPSVWLRFQGVIDKANFGISMAKLVVYHNAAVREAGKVSSGAKPALEGASEGTAYKAGRKNICSLRGVNVATFCEPRGLLM